jgi:hypothetical protein
MLKKISFNTPSLTGDEINNLFKLDKLEHYSANGFLRKNAKNG